MHRSGTSFTAGLMPFAGLRALEGSFRASASSNAKGNREIEELRLVNNRLMRSVGYEWDAIPPPFLPIDVSSVPDALLNEAREQFRSRVPAQPWHWKDPRLCLTLPVFRSLLQADEIPYVVFAFRHPQEVALSLQKRDDISLPLGLAMWEAHNRAALRAVEGLPTFFVGFEQSLAEPGALLERVHGQLVDDGVIDDVPPDRQGAVDWAEPSLRHNQADSDEPSNEVLPAQQMLYDLLCSRPAFEPSCSYEVLEPPSAWSQALMSERWSTRKAAAERRARQRQSSNRGLRRLAGKAKRTVLRRPHR